jgi:hypothetical protein
MAPTDFSRDDAPSASELRVIRNRLRLTQAHVFLVTALLAISWLSGFTPLRRSPAFEEIRAEGIVFVDSTGKARLRIGADLEKRGLAGLVFYNEDATEAGVLAYRGRRGADGKIDARSLLTMDQFKSDQVIALDSYQSGSDKRNGLNITDQPDSLSRVGAAVLDSLRTALNASKSNTEAQALRREYLARLPAGDRVVTRLFAGRDIAAASVISMFDANGKPRLRLRVDAQGDAVIEFLDAGGNTVRSIRPDR